MPPYGRPGGPPLLFKQAPQRGCRPIAPGPCRLSITGLAVSSPSTAAGESDNLTPLATPIMNWPTRTSINAAFSPNAIAGNRFLRRRIEEVRLAHVEDKGNFLVHIHPGCEHGRGRQRNASRWSNKDALPNPSARQPRQQLAPFVRLVRCPALVVSAIYSGRMPKIISFPL